MGGQSLVFGWFTASRIFLADILSNDLSSEIWLVMRSRVALYTGVRKYLCINSDSIIYRGLGNYRGIPFGSTNFQ